MMSGVMRTTVRSRRRWRITSWPAATGMRCVKPSKATVSPSPISSATESVVLEARDRDYVEKRVRAGVLEQGTVDLLIELGVGDRLQREGLVHHGVELRYKHEGHRIPLS